MKSDLLDLPAFREIVQTHGPLANEELRELLQEAVEVHEENDAMPPIGVSPCLLISMLLEILTRRMMAGDLNLPQETVQ